MSLRMWACLLLFDLQRSLHLGLNGAEGLVGLRWEDDAKGIVGVDGAAGEDDGHDAGAAGTLAGGVAWAPEMLLEARTEGVDLGAGGAEASNFEEGCWADVELGMEREGEKIDALGEEVFAEVAGVEVEAERG
jgi:hypothetical protein